MVAMTDEEQKTQVKSFMQSYGFPIIIGVALGAGGFLGWNWFQTKQITGNTQATDAVQQALVSVNANSDAEAYKQTKANLETVIKNHANTAQAVQAQVVLASYAFEQKDFALAETLLTQAQSSTIKDEGLKSVAGLHLAYLYIEQKQWDKALQTLDKITVESFIPSVYEAKGDVFVAQSKTEEAKTAYQLAWNKLIERKEYRELLQMKLSNLGVFVDVPEGILPVKQNETPTETATATTADTAAQVASASATAASSAN